MTENKLQKFKAYYLGEEITESLLVFIRRNWNEYKEWSNKQGK